MTRAAIYCRVSSDPEGDRLGVQRQEADCRKLCAEQGFDVAGVYVDDDVSAYSGKPRPAYQELCDDLKHRSVKVVVAWHPDRLHRSPRELEDFIVLLEAVKANVVTVQAGLWDLSTPAGRMIARQLGAVARYESEHKAERIRRRLAQNAERGLPGGGNLRPFGYADDKVTIIPAEATLIRAVATKIIAGETLRSATYWLNARGAATVTGKRWSTQTVRGILVNPRYAGLRAVGKSGHQRVVGEAVWKPILDRPTYEQLRAILLDPARRTNRAARTYLLSGLLLCGKCGGRLVSAGKNDTAPGNGRTYQCRADPRRDSCGGTRINARTLEEHVADLVLLYVASSAFSAMWATTTPDADDVVSAELADIDQRMATLGDRYGRGAIPEVAFHAGINALNARRTELSALVRQTSRVPAVLGRYVDDSDALARDWPAMVFDRQRALVVAVLEAIVIGPARPGWRGFDEQRIVEVRWRH
jgi:DNA invertase Pin-like site-specific DNA recombinase